LRSVRALPCFESSLPGRSGHIRAKDQIS
jgi:hypothetical protein